MNKICSFKNSGLIFLLFVIFSFTNLSIYAETPPHAYGMIGQQDDGYLPFAEVMPEPVGGLEGIYKKIVYPDIARKAGLEGKVYVLVFVNEHGGVDNAKVIKDIGGGCGDAAVKALKATKYSPGKSGGSPVKVKLSMAITFKMK